MKKISVHKVVGRLRSAGLQGGNQNREGFRAFQVNETTVHVLALVQDGDEVRYGTLESIKKLGYYSQILIKAGYDVVQDDYRLRVMNRDETPASES